MPIVALILTFLIFAMLIIITRYWQRKNTEKILSDIPKTEEDEKLIRRAIAEISEQRARILEVKLRRAKKHGCR